MARWRNPAVRFFAPLCLVLGAASGAEYEDPGGDAERHLERVISSYRIGDFEGAWRAFRAFFQEPEKNLIRPDVFVECFGYAKCPNLGVLGSVLGRTAEQAGPFASFCPRGAPPADPEEAAKSREAFHTLIEAVLGSCEQHAEKTANLMAARARNDRPRPHVVPFRPSPRDRNDPLPRVRIEVRDQQALALVDTGTTISEMNRLLRAGDTLASGRLRVDRLATEYEMDFARLGSLTVQDAVYRDVPATLVDLTWVEDGRPVPPEFGNIVGMDVLLRHEAACFDLRGRRLHLGALGPCAAGEPSNQAWLHGSHSIYVSVPTAQGHPLPAKLDTGSTTTFCSDAFLEANAGSKTFHIGDDSAFAVDCVHDAEVTFAGVGSGQRQILIGMDALGGLDAFGWQLNPLDVYLVPTRGEIGNMTEDNGNP